MHLRKQTYVAGPGSRVSVLGPFGALVLFVFLLMHDNLLVNGKEEL